MAQARNCIAPGCTDAQLINVIMESSPVNDRLYGPRCGKVYKCPTGWTAPRLFALCAATIQVIVAFLNGDDHG
jgi:hypothetical protein